MEAHKFFNSMPVCHFKLPFLIATFALAIAPVGLWAQDPSEAPQTSGDPAADLAYAQERDAAGNRQQAIAGYRSVAANHQFSPQGGEAQFRLAEILQQAGELDRAFKEYSFFITRYPGSANFDKALEAQVQIANAYLEGRRIRLLGIPISRGYERAQTMYQEILANAPFSKFAPMAQFNLGLSFEKQGNVPEAVNAYQVVMDRYPTSSVADDAMYQIGYIHMRVGFAGGSQDLSSLILAKNTFEDFLFQFPNSEKVPQAKENMEMITARESGDIMAIARFYDRSKDFRAAFIYYNDVIRRAASADEAEIARIRIEELRGEYGDDALRTGPDRAETGDRVALRRRLQAQVETPSLADYAGPPRRDVVREDLPVVRPRLRTQARDVAPLPPVEPDLPEQ